MTARQQRVFDAIVGAVVAVVLTATLTLVTGAWSGKESVAAHSADVAAIRSEVQRIRDLICLDHSSAPQCKGAP